MSSEVNMDKEWHLKNKFPKDGSEQEKNKWRSEHSRVCDCGKRKSL
jgi:hypothetical protein